MKPVFVKPATQEEIIQEACPWFLRLSDRNLYDPTVLLYPATKVLKAEADGRTIAYVPVQTVLMPDALGIREDATPMETAAALKAVIQVLAFQSAAQGSGEMYFLCRDEETVKFAEHNGMERVNIPVFRRKI